MELILTGLKVVCTPGTLLWIVLGVVLGVIKKTSIARPRQQTANCSAELNFRASCISGWVRANMMMQLARPPRPELTRATVRALPASAIYVVFVWGLGTSVPRGVGPLYDFGRWLEYLWS